MISLEVLIIEKKKMFWKYNFIALLKNSYSWVFFYAHNLILEILFFFFNREKKFEYQLMSVF